MRIISSFKVICLLYLAVFGHYPSNGQTSNNSYWLPSPLIANPDAAFYIKCDGKVNGLYAKNPYCETTSFVVCVDGYPSAFGCPANTVISPALVCETLEACKQYNGSGFGHGNGVQSLAYRRSGFFDDSVQWAKEKYIAGKNWICSKAPFCTVEGTDLVEMTVEQSFCGVNSSLIVSEIHLIETRYVYPLHEWVTSKADQLCDNNGPVSAALKAEAQDNDEKYISPVGAKEPDCEFCSKSVKLMINVLDSAKLLGRTTVLKLCEHLAEADKKICTDFEADLLKPMISAAKALLSEDIVCKIITRPCIGTAEMRKYDRYINPAGTETRSCELCVDMVKKAVDVVNLFLSSSRSFAKMFCGGEVACETGWGAAVGGVSSLLTNYQDMAMTKCKALNCFDIDAPVQNQCCHPRDKIWKSCTFIECRNGKYVKCADGQGKFTEKRCTAPSGASHECPTLMCERTDGDQIDRFSCLFPSTDCKS